MESKVTAKYIKSSPRKARLVADVIRGQMVGDALNALQLGIHKEVARDFAKVVKSAVANIQQANENAAVHTEDLRVREVLVNTGPVLRRYRARAQGRAGRILKRMCHISVTVSS